MEIVNETSTRGKKKDIREQIWDLLVAKGFKESSHSSKILKKQIEVRSSYSISEKKTIEVTVKYKFGANNLQKFRGGIKKYSIPFCSLEIRDGKISKKK